jgi:hypothetical protein
MVQEKGEPRKYSNTCRGMENIIKYINENCIDLFPKNQHFIDTVNKKTEGKIFFLDKYYDFEKKAFFNITKQNLPIIFINRNAPTCLDKISKQDIDNYKRDFLNMFSNDDLDNILKMTARALSGHINDKSWAGLVGTRNSGKGLYQGNVEHSFGDYCSVIELPMLSSSNSGDASSFRWVISQQCHLKRLAFTNEIKEIEGKAPLKLDGNAMKKCVSGGDKIICRELYKAEQTAIFNCFIMASLNKFPESSPSDAYMNVVPIKMPHKYVEDPVDICERQRDSSIKDKIKTDTNRDIFMKIIFDAYGDCLQEKEWSAASKAQYLDINKEKASEPIYIFKTNFQKSPESFISTADFKHIFREAKMSDKQLGSFLSLRLKPFKKTMENGKRTCGYKGVKIIEEERDGESSDSDNEL